MKTAEQISQECDHLNGEKNLSAINKLFLGQDESNLWPISNRFNATRRAINRIKRMVKSGMVQSYGLEYALGLNQTISSIVNDPKLL